MAHNKTVSKLMQKEIEGQLYTPKLHLEYLFCIWNYHKMVFYFWIWDLRKMVNDREKFDEVHATDDLEAVRKRVVPNTHVANLSCDAEKR